MIESLYIIIKRQDIVLSTVDNIETGLNDAIEWCRETAVLMDGEPDSTATFEDEDCQREIEHWEWDGMTGYQYKSHITIEDVHNAEGFDGEAHDS